MIQQEELHIKQFTTGVTFFIFSDAIYDQLPENPDQYEGPFPSYVVYNMQGEIYSLNYFTGNVIWTRNENNNYIPIDEIGWDYKTGYTLVKTVVSNMTQDNIDNMSSLMLQRLSNPDRLGTPPSASAATNYVFFRKKIIDDFYVDIKMERSYNSLDTLKIYNNLINSFPNQESPTGVVFGRLTAIQKIKNETGENLRIPLKNVPIGIFNSSDDFPSLFSTDDNGDRLTLNIKEAASQNQYFNSYSYFSDYNQYLKSADSFSAVPAQYKYVTLTNDNGEFILYDVPVDQQTAIFEVDLFKQGLTKDEIALNFFPFPGTEDANIDSIPSFVYKQFPVDVVPAWGLGQTGYTSLDININLDLRKWATFYVPPISYNGYKLESAEIATLGSTLNVEVRDMSRVGFPTTNLPIVQIPNILEKDTNQALLWLNEFSQLTNSIRFDKNGFNAFKVRANMYDPNGYRTDSNGFPVYNPYNKGVWLAGYQFLIYFNNRSSIFRSTGFQMDFGFPGLGWIGRDNFHLNRGIIQNSTNSDTSPNFQFPYNKPWTIDFPEKYSIPHIPTQLNFQRTDITTRLRDASNRAYLEQPLYLDGDMVGLAVNNPSVNSQGVGGYGLQYSFNSSFWFGNRFAQEITNKSIYRYENRVAWNEKYSNGYEPQNPGFSVQPGVSQVIGGEKYQRVECGYGYWLKPDGWPPIAIQSYGDDIFSEALRPTGVLSSTSGPGILTVGDTDGNLIVKAQNLPIDIYNVDEKDITLALDSEATFPEGGLNIYRIIDSNSFLPPGDPITPTFITLNFGPIYVQRGPVESNSVEIRMATADDIDDGVDDEYFSRIGYSTHADNTYNELMVYIKNQGVISVEIPGVSTLGPGGEIEVSAVGLALNNLSITLPGNSNFDFIESKYTKAKYRIEFRNVRLGKTDTGPFTLGSYSVPYTYYIYGPNGLFDMEFDASSNIPNYYLVHRWVNVKTNYNRNTQQIVTGGGYSGTGDKWKNNIKADGVLFPVFKDGDIDTLYGTGASSVNSPKFQSLPIAPTQSNGVTEYNGNKYSIPIECEFLDD